MSTELLQYQNSYSLVAGSNKSCWWLIDLEETHLWSCTFPSFWHQIALSEVFLLRSTRFLMHFTKRVFLLHVSIFIIRAVLKWKAQSYFLMFHILFAFQTDSLQEPEVEWINWRLQIGAYTITVPKVEAYRCPSQTLVKTSIMAKMNDRLAEITYINY